METSSRNTGPITVEMCLAGRDLTEPRLSPDGATVAFVARWGSNAAIITSASGIGPERIVTTEPAPAPGRGLGGGCFDWLPDGGGLVYAARDGDLWLQPVPGGPPRRITDLGGERAVAAPSVAADGSLVAAVVDQAEVWYWRLDDGSAGRIDDGSADFCFDPHVAPCSSTVSWMAWNVPDMPWDAARVVTCDLVTGEVDTIVGAGAIQQPRSLPGGRSICLRDDTGWRNVWVDGRPLVDEPFEHGAPTWGLGQRSFAHSPDGREVVFTRNERGFGRLCRVDVATGVVVEVARGVHGQLSWSGDRVAAVRTGARTPTQIVLYDTSAWQRRVVAVGPVAGWELAGLPEPELVEVDHAGVILHARRYAAGNGRTLCWVHGGPTDQWQVEFMPRVAYWWSRGWDILVPDPRGSTGHGRRYQQALHGQWGRLDVDDTAAILRDAHRCGRSHPDRTVVMGSSSGGLTALGVLGLHPGLAAGGVTSYPVTDLGVLADESHRFEAHYTISLVGPLDDHERYERHSPLAYAASIDVPLLVMHGSDDPVVPVGSSVAFVERMRAAGRDVDFVVMDGEGHGFRDPANKRADFELTDAFLRRVVTVHDG